jgi:putative membrane protein
MQIKQQFNWRYLLVRLIVSMLSLLVVALLMPKIYFVEPSFFNLVLISVSFGILNALVKPIIQFLTLPFIFATYGLVIAFINALILLLLTWLFPDRFAVTSLFWAVIGGLLVGVLGGFLDSLLGLTRPIIPDKPVSQRLNESAPEPIVLKTVLGDHAQVPEVELADISQPVEPASLPTHGEENPQNVTEEQL